MTGWGSQAPQVSACACLSHPLSSRPPSFWKWPEIGANNNASILDTAPRGWGSFLRCREEEPWGWAQQAHDHCLLQHTRASYTLDTWPVSPSLSRNCGPDAAEFLGGCPALHRRKQSKPPELPGATGGCSSSGENPTWVSPPSLGLTLGPRSGGTEHSSPQTSQMLTP